MVGAGGGVHHAVQCLSVFVGDIVHSLGPGGGGVRVWRGHDDDQVAAPALQLRTDAEMIDVFVKDSGNRRVHMTYWCVCVFLCVFCACCLCVCIDMQEPSCLHGCCAFASVCRYIGAGKTGEETQGITASVPGMLFKCAGLCYWCFNCYTICYFLAKSIFVGSLMRASMET